MTIQYADRVKETTETTGTGPLSLGGAPDKFQSFVSGVGDGGECYYCAVNLSQNEWEVGVGTITAGSPDTLSRDNILTSSNSGGAVSFSAGVKEVFLTQAAKSIADQKLTTNIFEKQVRSEPLLELDGATLQTGQSLTINVVGVLLLIDAGTPVTLPTLTSHTDYKIWADNTGALTAQAWDDPDPADSRWIGGFHAYHTDATINPASIWDLGYRPVCNPRAMAISPDKRVWFDIYLMDTAYGVNGYSRGNAEIADDLSRPIIPAYFGGNGTATYAGMMWWHAVDLAIAAGKRLPFYGEFTGAAYGVVENSARGTDPVTTGKDVNFRSAIGLEQVTGCMWQWGADIAATAGTSWNDIADNRGDVHADNIKAVLLGADWSDGANAGSRASNWSGTPDLSVSSVGARAVCDHLSL